MKANRPKLGALLALLAAGVLFAGLHADEAKKPETPKSDAKASTDAKPAAAVTPKALSDQVKKGLEYLVNQQHASGGWGQGGGWRTGQQGGRVEGANVEDPPDVANTCVAALALIRAGNTPKSGPYAKNVAKAIDFIGEEIEKADKESLYITQTRGTQVQSKIGPYVDTFLATLVMSELKGKMQDDKGEKKLAASWSKTIAKIGKHQKADGSFEGNVGWASVISQGIANKAVSRGAQGGQQVAGEVLAKAERNAVDSFDKSGQFKSGSVVAGGPGIGGAGRGGAAGYPGAPGSAAGGRASGKLGDAPLGGGASTSTPTDAGVALYGTANQLGALQEAVNAGRQKEEEAKKIIANKDAPKADRDRAEKQLESINQTRMLQQQATDAVVRQLRDERFVSGFGSNGGEEFLSYMNLAETLLVKGGKEWSEWDNKMTENINRVQNKDGSWSGHHCITGRTFCTGTALLVLMADRAPIPEKK